MSQTVEYPVEGGGSVLVVVEPSPGDDMTTRGWGAEQPKRVVEQASASLEATLAQIRPTADALLGSLAGLATAPDEVTVEFAVQLTAEAGICIATLGSSANFRISLTWRPTP